jgi:N-acylneuraminate cytidylyltransferase/CMP-N,N'-diacetyllegionaminic acid synthase
MFKGRTIIGLIPARGGSKRLPGKNILDLCGRPLVAHTISEAGKSRYLDGIIVSTDDSAISAVAKRYGASVPFIRPARLASDRAKTADVALHALERLEESARACDIVAVLQPTSPLRRSSDIDAAIELLFRKRASAVVSVTWAGGQSLWPAVTRNGLIKKAPGAGAAGASRKGYYRLNGALYVIYADALKKTSGFYPDKTYAYVMPKERSVDIDDITDFKLAEFLIKRR